MKTASILTVSLIFVAFNGVACLSYRENAMKELRGYIKELQICPEKDPRGADLIKMLLKYRMEGVIRFTCGHSSGPSFHLYYILWRFVFDFKPLRLAERVFKDLSLQTAIDELKKKYLDKHKLPDKQALFGLLGDFTKKVLMSEEKVNYYKKQLEEGLYLDANELAKQVLEDLRFQTAIGELKDFQIEYGLGMKTAGVGLYEMFQKYKTQGLISLNIFKEYEKKLTGGENRRRIACAALTHLTTELRKSLGLFYMENAIKEIDGYIKKLKTSFDYDPDGVKLFRMLRKFHNEGVISESTIDVCKVWKDTYRYLPKKIAEKVRENLLLQKAIDELEKYLKGHKKPDEKALFKLLGDFKTKGVIKEDKFKNYETLLQAGTCSDANKLAKKVLTDLRIQKAKDELEELQDNYIEGDKKPDELALLKLFDKFKRQGLIYEQKYKKYEGMLLDANLATIACVAIADFNVQLRESAGNCK